MDISEIINKNAIEIGFHAKSKAEVLDRLAELLLLDDAISSKEIFLQDVMKREAEGITGIGDDIAIPHGKSATVKKNCVALCICQEPIAWESIDDTPVRIVVLFAVKAVDTDLTHLRMMAAVASALADQEVRSAIKEAKTASELVRALNKQRKEATALR